MKTKDQGNGREAWQVRAERVLAQGCLTYSKSRRYYVSAQPSHVFTGDGKHLVGTDGELIFDTVSGLGANLIDCTNSYSLPTEIEVEVAEELLRRVPFERVKFVKTGSEADQAAARFMRAYTGKQGIFKIGYSGWHSEFIAAEDNSVGCPYTDVTKFASIDELITALKHAKPGDIAGVIMEPVMLDCNVRESLIHIRQYCHSIGALLTFDEVITGFRFPRYTVAQTCDVMPDLMTMGKALGGGYPLGCLLGPARVLDKEGVFVSGTFAGETSALKAAKEVLNAVSADVLRLFWEQANDFHRKWNFHAAPHMYAEGYGTRMVLKDKKDGLNVAKFMQECYLRHRVLIGPVLFPKISWQAADYTKLLSITEEIVKDLPDIQLVGEKPRPVFKRNN